MAMSDATLRVLHAATHRASCAPASGAPRDRVLPLPLPLLLTGSASSPPRPRRACFSPSLASFSVAEGGDMVGERWREPRGDHQRKLLHLPWPFGSTGLAASMTGDASGASIGVREAACAPVQPPLVGAAGAHGPTVPTSGPARPTLSVKCPIGGKKEGEGEWIGVCLAGLVLTVTARLRTRPHVDLVAIQLV